MAAPQLPGTMIVDGPQADPWEQAFGSYQQALLDLNGDGVPDVAVPVSNQERRGISRRAMYGRSPDEKTQARLNADMPRLEQNAETLASITNIPQTGRAFEKAYADPSIPTLTNAGMNAMLTAARPIGALKVLGSGLAAAAASDFGLFGGSAEAQSTDRSRRNAARAEADAARAQGAAATAKAQAEAAVLAAQTEANRVMAEQRQKEANAALLRQKEAEKQAEYTRSVVNAEKQRDAIRATDTQFKDSKVGKVYEETGGYAPMLLGAAGGLVHRLAAGPTKGVVDKYVMPALEGTALTFAALNAPLLYNSFSTPALNPQRQALETYARELPLEHPLKMDAAEQARKLPINNLIADNAWKEMTDPMGQARRLGSAFIEGAPAGLFGRNLPDATRAVVQGASELPGVIRESYHKAMAAADKAALRREAIAERTKAGSQSRGGSNQGSDPPKEYSRYASVPQSYRDNTVDALLAARSVAGGDIPATGTAKAIRDAHLSYNIKIPVTPQRVDKTQEIINQFTASNGRPPTRRELMPLLDPKNLGTLAIPAAVGASALNPMLQAYYGD